MKLIVNGADGRMGSIICGLAEQGAGGFEMAAYVSPTLAPNAEEHCYLTLKEFTGEADCVIDFSHHTAAPELLAYCKERNLPVLIATTGQTEEEKAMIMEASKSIPVFYSGNMSLGIAVLADLAKRAAAAFPGADIEIVEMHHNQKLDVPSGTALMLANAVKEARPEAEFVVGRHENGKRKPEEIGIHSLRFGSEVGTHEILISTGRETITLKHQAENRALFADGAIAAASWLVGKPAGLYNMKDIVK